MDTKRKNNSKSPKQDKSTKRRKDPSSGSQIEEEKSVTHVPDPSVVPIEISGNLHKQGRLLKKWKPRFFQVQGDNLYYFKSYERKECLGLIDLQKCYYVGKSAAASFGFAFELQTWGRTHLLAARDERDAERWIKIIKKKMVPEARERDKKGSKNEVDSIIPGEVRTRRATIKMNRSGKKNVKTSSSVHNFESFDENDETEVDIGKTLKGPAVSTSHSFPELKSHQIKIPSPISENEVATINSGTESQTLPQTSLKNVSQEASSRNQGSNAPILSDQTIQEKVSHHISAPEVQKPHIPEDKFSSGSKTHLPSQEVHSVVESGLPPPVDTSMDVSSTIPDPINSPTSMDVSSTLPDPINLPKSMDVSSTLPDPINLPKSMDVSSTLPDPINLPPLPALPPMPSLTRQGKIDDENDIHQIPKHSRPSRPLSIADIELPPPFPIAPQLKKSNTISEIPFFMNTSSDLGHFDNEVPFQLPQMEMKNLVDDKTHDVTNVELPSALIMPENQSDFDVAKVALPPLEIMNDSITTPGFDGSSFEQGFMLNTGSVPSPEFVNTNSDTKAQSNFATVQIQLLKEKLTPVTSVEHVSSAVDQLKYYLTNEQEHPATIKNQYTIVLPPEVNTSWHTKETGIEQLRSFLVNCAV